MARLAANASSRPSVMSAPAPLAPAGDVPAGELALWSSCQALGQVAHEVVDRDTVLVHGVPLSDGDRTVLEGVEIDGDAIRRAQLVLAAVATTDGLGLVV